MLAFDHVTPAQRIIFRTGGAAGAAAEAVADLGSTRVLLIHSGSAAETAESVRDLLPVAGEIRRARRHVPAADADDATALATASGADLLLSIGGGSATGLAKIVAMRTGLPIVAIPTTFAGSEATSVWGLTEAAQKTTGTDPLALPAIIVYDAALTTGLPTPVALASGLNAVAHAVDSIWAPRADPLNRAAGLEALRVLAPALRSLHAAPGSIEPREQTLYGAYLAATAFASAGSGMHHKICHTLGGAFDLPHAELHAIVLPYVADFNLRDEPELSAVIERALGVDGAAAAALDALRRELGAPRGLREIGIVEADLPRAVELALPAIPPSNPRPVGAADLDEILHAAWAGDPID